MHLSTNLGPEGVGMLRLNRVVPLRYKWKKVKGKKRLCSNHWFTGTVDKLVPRACVTRCAWLRRPIMKQLVADPGEGSAEPGPSPFIFRANWGPKDRKRFVWRPPPPPPPPPPLSKGLDDPHLLISRSGSGTVKNRSHLHLQLCACITLFCTFLCRHCTTHHDVKMPIHVS